MLAPSGRAVKPPARGGACEQAAARARSPAMPARTERAIELLLAFAGRTGLGSSCRPQRYLWTDAFAVCTLLGLGHATGESRFAELALRLVDEVHHVLGRHRADDTRTGWISGLPEADGAAHPTCGGLRIGKPLPERGPREPLDERLEWDRDGQYFHYLTKWMHALDQATRSSGRLRFTTWARELAHAAHRAFTYVPRPGGPPRMYWKLSIDLSRPLVESMGQHDPLDGYVACIQLDATAPGATPSLREAIAGFAAMIDARSLATGDPLGLGGLLADAHRLAQLAGHGADTDALVEALLAAALAGLRQYAGQSDLRAPAHHRLAFRELGLAIGLAAIEPAAWREASDGVRARVDRLARYVPLRAEIEAFWLEPEHRRVATWLEHENINDVMLATSLAPEGFLRLGSVPRSPRVPVD